MFLHWKLMFSVRKHVFSVQKHKFAVRKHKSSRCGNINFLTIK